MSTLEFTYYSHNEHRNIRVDIDSWKLRFHSKGMKHHSSRDSERKHHLKDFRCNISYLVILFYFYLYVNRWIDLISSETKISDKTNSRTNLTTGTVETCRTQTFISTVAVNRLTCTTIRTWITLTYVTHLTSNACVTHWTSTTKSAILTCTSTMIHAWLWHTRISWSN